MGEKLLKVENLSVQYVVENETVEAVNDLSLELDQGETLGLVGETGAGKTTLALGVMRLIPDPPGRIVRGEIRFQGKNLLKLSDREMRNIRGNKISMIFQDPMTSLNPVMPVGEQIAEVLALHNRLSKAELHRRAIDALEAVGIPGERFGEYPHQFSGGMKQRVVIAIALACNPILLIADEPTTALDVTIQAQVLQLMEELRQRLNTAMLLITHDLGVVADICQKVAIMYAGEIVEYGTLFHIFEQAAHPYTRGLFDSLPSLDNNVRRLTPIPGMMPDPSCLPAGCPFAERCAFCRDDCRAARPAYLEIHPGHYVKCVRAGEENG